MAYYPFGGKTYNLETSISSTVTSITLSSFLEPVTDTPYTMALLNTTIAFGTIAPKTSSSEFISFTGITQNSNGTATLTGVTRGLAKKYPFTTDSSYKLPHSGQTQFIISDAPQVFFKYGSLVNDEVITGQWEAPDPITAQGIVTRDYMLALINGGAISTNSVVVAGIAGTTLASGNLVYFDTATGQWKKTDATTAATVNNVIIGIAQGSGTVGNTITGGVLLKGLDATQTGMVAGTIMYAANTAGTISSSAGTTQRAIGIAQTATGLYFDPEFYYVVTADQKAALAGTSGTPSSTNQYATKESLDLKSNIVFGGTGADDALTITSGTTTINCANAAVVTKNYTSISITGTGKLAFSNPNTNGTVIVLKSQGAVTLTSSSTPMIDASALGAAAATDAYSFSVFKVNKGSNGGAFNAPGNGGAILSINTANLVYSEYSGKYPYTLPGAGGGAGSSSNAGGGGGASTLTSGSAGSSGTNSSGGTGGTGGAGGGSLIIECAGAWNFTTASGISVAGAAGNAGTGSQAGGGGGGGAGVCLVFYNTLTANSGTITVSGGSGGAGAGGGGAGGSGAAGYSLVTANTEFA